jgi:hypothetical protein
MERSAFLDAVFLAGGVTFILFLVAQMLQRLVWG